MSMITKFKQHVMKMFVMTSIGLMNYFLWIVIDQTKENFHLSKNYATNKEVYYEGCKPISILLSENI